MEDVLNMENESFMEERGVMENEYWVNVGRRLYYKKGWNKGFVNIVNILGGWMVMGRGGRGKWYGIVKS